MSKVIIYHNPKCSKSRETLELLLSQGIEPEIVPYLESPLNLTELQSIYEKLQHNIKIMVRLKEPLFKELGLAKATDLLILESVSRFPQLLERPIVLANGKAAVGRPPESVLTIL